MHRNAFALHKENKEKRLLRKKRIEKIKKKFEFKIPAKNENNPKMKGLRTVRRFVIPSFNFF